MRRGDADLHYRDVLEYAVGHGVSAESLPVVDGVCRAVRTSWLPSAEVERVDHFNPQGVDLSMESLGAAADATVLKEKLQNSLNRNLFESSFFPKFKL